MSRAHSLSDADAVDAYRADCWARFNAAADAAIAGDYTPAREYLRGVHARHGVQIAEQQRRELWAYVAARRQRNGEGMT